MERKQFGAPLAAFQINQQKLVQMLGNVQAMFLVGWRLCKLYESGKMTVGQASLGKVTIFCQVQPLFIGLVCIYTSIFTVSESPGLDHFKGEGNGFSWQGAAWRQWNLSRLFSCQG